MTDKRMSEGQETQSAQNVENGKTTVQVPFAAILESLELV